MIVHVGLHDRMSVRTSSLAVFLVRRVSMAHVRPVRKHMVVLVGVPFDTNISLAVATTDYAHVSTSIALTLSS
ncbi:hypothetical protein, partial [Streptococcus pneumoniae]|uniref:hypothetical protein n=1 Tax=Streptococcus pneumoniae TaxID=1313 RepID=UPI00195F3AD1